MKHAYVVFHIHGEGRIRMGEPVKDWSSVALASMLVERLRYHVLRTRKSDYIGDITVEAG